MKKTLKSTFIVLVCAVGLTACNANNPHHVSTASALVVGIGVGSLLHGHNGYRHSHRNSRGHSHRQPQRGNYRPYIGNNRPQGGGRIRPGR